MTRRDIELFTEISGDRNPLHYDDDVAARSRFGGIVVQGGVTTAVLNAVVAEDLPGPGSVFLQLDLRFLAPVRPGDVITGTVGGDLRPRRQADHRPGRAGGARRRRGGRQRYRGLLDGGAGADAVTRPLVLERGAELDVLETALRRATTGTGSVVLVSGEAGIGKTSLVRAFVLDRPDRARVLLGACDDLVTPRTLGPLRDAVRGARGPLATALAGGDRDAVLSALLAELADGTRPTVLVLEDVHWADDATLDVLRYVGRRVVDLPAVLVVDLPRRGGRAASLQRVLGALGGPAVHRLPRPGSPARRWPG